MRRHLYVARQLARDPAIPRWVRGLLVFGALPIPGPVDDVALVFAALVVLVFYRHRIAHHYAIEATVPAVPADTWGGWS